MGGCRRRMFAGLGACALVWATVAPVGAAGGKPAVRITASLPGSGTVGTVVVIRGRAAHAPDGSRAELEFERGGVGGLWTVLARTSVRIGRFSLRWTPRSAGFLTLRVRVVRHGRTLARGSRRPVVIGSAPVYCAAPGAPGRLPAGYGYVVGGVYNVGGPAPGITVCQGSANTVTVTDASGRPVASRTVTGGQSYTFVLPAGSYTLKAGFCQGSATVRSGAETRADTICPVP